MKNYDLFLINYDTLKMSPFGALEGQEFEKIVTKEKELDEVILTYFKIPKSYTWEDVIEI